MVASILSKLAKWGHTLYFTIIFLFFNLQIVIAEEQGGSSDIHLNKLNFCRITERSFNDHEPEEFAKSNNMVRMPGQEPVYCGQRIVVYGKLLDQNCVPVSDAKVYAWQVGCDAKYPYKPLKPAVDKDMHGDKNGTFVGHGTATTNNKGEFIFITVYPKAAHDLGPHINFRADHRDIGVLNTSIELFNKRVANPNVNPDLEAILSSDDDDTNSPVYEINIVMPGSTNDYY